MAIIITGAQWGDEGKTKFFHQNSLRIATILEGKKEIQKQCMEGEDNRIIGVIKAYTTRTDLNAFPTEVTEEIAEVMRRLGDEYDLVTGKPRRCGWLDLVPIKRTIKEKGITELAISHIDTIGEIAQKTKEIQVCTHYWNRHVLVKEAPDNLKYCRPCYETFYGGWEIENCKRWEDLHERAKYYIEHIERFLEIPIKYVSIGPKDNQVIIRPK